MARTFFNVYLDAELGISPASIGWTIGLAQLLSVPAALIMPYVLAKTDHVQVFTYTTLGIALALLPMAFIPRWEAAGLGYVSIVMLVAVRMPAFAVFHQELVAPRWRSTMSASDDEYRLDRLCNHLLRRGTPRPQHGLYATLSAGRRHNLHQRRAVQGAGRSAGQRGVGMSPYNGSLPPVIC